MVLCYRYVHFYFPQEFLIKKIREIYSYIFFPLRNLIEKIKDVLSIKVILLKSHFINNLQCEKEQANMRGKEIFIVSILVLFLLFYSQNVDAKLINPAAEIGKAVQTYVRELAVSSFCFFFFLFLKSFLKKYLMDLFFFFVFFFSNFFSDEHTSFNDEHMKRLISRMRTYGGGIVVAVKIEIE